MPPARVTRVLDRLAAWRGYLAGLRLDNGPELVSVALAEWAEEHRVALDFIQPGKPTQNSFIERFNRTYREEVILPRFCGHLGKRVTFAGEVIHEQIEKWASCVPSAALG